MSTPHPSRAARAHARQLAVFACLAALAAPAMATRSLGDALDADPSLREARNVAREAARDTAGHGADSGRLSALGTAVLKLGRLAEADKLFRRALALDPHDGAALAGLGKLELFAGRDAAAESLLALAGDADGAAADRYAVKLRRGDWSGAAALAEAQADAGRVDMFERLAAGDAWRVGGTRERVELFFERPWPAALVNVRLNGQRVLMAIDTGASETLIDPLAARVNHLATVPGERSVLWDGAHVAGRNAIAQTLDFGGLTLSNVPVAVTSLRSYSLTVNPQGVGIAGVIGMPVLRRLGVTLDYPRQRLVLSRPGTQPVAAGVRAPFEWWGENELMVWATVGGNRRMALQVATGLPGAGFGAPPEVFEELGLKPGRVANFVRSGGSFFKGQSWAQVGVPAIAVGAIVEDKVNGWSGALERGELWRHGVRRDGLLGPEFFRDHRTTFDWDKHELVFEHD